MQLAIDKAERMSLDLVGDMARILDDLGEFHLIEVNEKPGNPHSAFLELDFTEKQLHEALSSPIALADHAAMVVHHVVYGWAMDRRNKTRPPDDPPGDEHDPSRKG